MRDGIIMRALHAHDQVRAVAGNSLRINRVGHPHRRQGHDLLGLVFYQADVFGQLRPGHGLAPGRVPQVERRARKEDHGFRALVQARFVAVNIGDSQRERGRRYRDDRLVVRLVQAARRRGVCGCSGWAVCSAVCSV